MIEAFFQYPFLQNAFFTGVMIGLIAPLLGVFLVVRRLSLIADALSHITLSGIAASLLLAKYVAFMQSIHPIYFGMGFSIGGALFIERLRTVYTHYKEIAIPIIMSAGIGLGVIFISLADGFNNDLFHYLFGSVIVVSRTDLSIVFVITCLVVVVTVLLYKELFFLSFDEEQAIIAGISRRLIHFIFIVLVALVIAASMRIVGILLVSSLMTLPVAAAIRIARGFKQLIIYSIVFGECAVVFGLFSAYYLDIAPGGMIVMIAVVILLFALSWQKLSQKERVS